MNLPSKQVEKTRRLKVKRDGKLVALPRLPYKDKKSENYYTKELTTDSALIGRLHFFEKKADFTDKTQTRISCFFYSPLEEKFDEGEEKKNEVIKKIIFTEIKYLDETFDNLLIMMPDVDNEDKTGDKKKLSDAQYVTSKINLSKRDHLHFYMENLKNFFHNNKIFPQSQKKNIDKLYWNKISECVNASEIAKTMMNYILQDETNINKLIRFKKYIGEYLQNFNTKMLETSRFALNAILLNFNKKFISRDKWGNVRKAYRVLDFEYEYLQIGDIIFSENFMTARSREFKIEDDYEILDNFPGGDTIFEFNFIPRKYHQNFQNYYEISNKDNFIDILIAPFTKFCVDKIEIYGTVQIIKVLEREDNPLMDGVFGKLIKKSSHCESFKYKINYCKSLQEYYDLDKEKEFSEKYRCEMKIGRLYNEFSQTRALFVYQKAFRYLEYEYGLNHIETIKYYNTLGDCLKKTNKIRAIDLYESALTVYINLYSSENINVATQYNKIAEMIEDSERLTYYNSTLDLMIKIDRINGENGLMVAYMYEKIANFHKNNKDYALAIENFNRSILIKEKYHSLKTEICILLNQIAECECNLLNYERALKIFGDVLKIKESIYKIDHKLVKKQFKIIFNCYLIIFQGDKGLEFIENIIIRYRKEFGDESPQVAEAYSFVASRYEKLYYLTKCLEYYEIGLKMKVKIHNFISKEVASQNYYMARTYLKMRNKVKSKEYYKNSIDILSQLFGNNSYEVALIYKKYGNMYFSLKKYNKAKKNYLASIKILSIFENNDSIKAEISKLYMMAGDCVRDQKHDQEESELYLKSLNIVSKIYGEKSSKLVKRYDIICEMLRTKLHFDLALQFSNKLTSLKIEIYGDDGNEIAEHYKNIALSLKSEYKYEKITFFKKSIDIKCLAFEDDGDTEMINSYVEIGDLIKNYDKEICFQYFQRSVEIVEKNYKPNSFEAAKHYSKLGEYLIFFDLEKSLHFFSKFIQIIRILKANETPNNEKNLELLMSQHFKKFAKKIFVQKSDVSLKLLTDAMEIDIKYFQKESTTYIEDLIQMGELLLMKSSIQAISKYEEGLELAVSVKNNSDLLVTLYELLGKSYKKVEFEKSKYYFELYIAEKEKSLGIDINSISIEYRKLAHNLRANEDIALYYYNKCIDAKVDLFGEESADVEEVYEEVSDLLRYKDPSKAEEFLNKALEIKKKVFGTSSKKVKEHLKKISSFHKKPTLISLDSDEKKFQRKNWKSSESDNNLRKTTIVRRFSTQIIPNDQRRTSFRKKFSDLKLTLNYAGIPEEPEETKIVKKTETSKDVQITRKKRNSLMKTQVMESDPNKFTIEQKENELGKYSLELAKFYKKLGDHYKFTNIDLALKYFMAMIHIKIRHYTKESNEIADDYKYCGICALYHSAERAKYYFENEKNLRRMIQEKKKDECIFI